VFGLGFGQSFRSIAVRCSCLTAPDSDSLGSGEVVRIAVAASDDLIADGTAR